MYNPIISLPQTVRVIIISLIEGLIQGKIVVKTLLCKETNYKLSMILYPKLYNLFLY